MSALSLVAAQVQFTAELKAVEDAVKFAFRGRICRRVHEALVGLRNGPVGAPRRR